MQASLILLVLLSATCIHNTDASWFRRIVRQVKGWISKHCRSNGEGAVGCTAPLGKRDNVMEDSDDDNPKVIDCQEVRSKVTGDVIPAKILEELFADSDANQDGVLNDAEQAQYSTVLAVIEECLQES